MKIRIVALPRSGSNYLISMLDEQMCFLEDYFCIFEPFNKGIKHQLTEEQIISNIKNKKNILVKSMIFELDRINLDEIFDYNICLTRKNVFEATLSRVIALKTNKWHEAFDPEFKISIDPAEFKYFINETLNWNKKILGLNYYKLLFYEDLTFNSASDLELLDLPIKHASIYKTKKLYSKSNLVINYKELKQEFKNYDKIV